MFGGTMQKQLLAIVLLSNAVMVSGASISFSLVPAAEISGAPGSTIGWGFSVTNNSTLDFYEPTNLNAGAFSNGTAALLFDILGLDLAPGANAIEQFDSNLGTGLYQLTWDPTAPLGFVNTGAFTLSGSFFEGDPNNGGTFDTFAPDATASYSATVSGASAVPEPSSFAYSTLGLLAAAGVTGARLFRHKFGKS
jgi:hypothetical protein